MEHPAPDDRPFLIQVSSLSAVAREAFAVSVAQRYRVWLFVGGAGRTQTVTWEGPYIVGHTGIDTQDAPAMIEAARALDARLRAEHGRGVAGVVCYDEARIVDAAALAAALGLPTSPPEAVARCRDKHATRTALAAADVPQPRSRAVADVPQAVAAAEAIGYPVVIKPRNLAASFGVLRVDAPDGIAAAHAHALSIDLPEEKNRYEAGVLVEEYLDGPEISVDAACFDGRVVPLGVAHKELGFAPAFEEVGHLVDGADPLLRDPDLLAVLTGAHAALGFHTGVTHTELRHSRGVWKVVEVNGRLGGGLIPHLDRLATGVDVNLAAADIAAGRTPELTPGPSRVAAIQFLYPDHDMTIAEIRVDTAALPPEVERAGLLAPTPREVKLPPNGQAWESRIAQIVAVADTEQDCRAALEVAAKAFTVIPATEESAP
ncbi:ATP-grasp domain-containing protein [Catenulispora yoronensis]|uniref:ATP-grasp domain-containing protein n=1 Tax=Catenulispora yoronensis TaxID=450799 RepID=UPI0031DCB1DC